jgi:hypothetical protein
MILSQFDRSVQKVRQKRKRVKKDLESDNHKGVNMSKHKHQVRKTLFTYDQKM